MNRGEVARLLEERRELTGMPFDTQGKKADAWYAILNVHDYGRIRARLRSLCGRGEKPELNDLVAGIRPPEHDLPTHSNAGEEYLPWSDPRAQAAFRQGYFEATGREWTGDDPTKERQ